MILLAALCTSKSEYPPPKFILAGKSIARTTTTMRERTNGEENAVEVKKDHRAGRCMRIATQQSYGCFPDLTWMRFASSLTRSRFWMSCKNGFTKPMLLPAAKRSLCPHMNKSWSSGKINLPYLTCKFSSMNPLPTLSGEGSFYEIDNILITLLSWYGY